METLIDDGGYHTTEMYMGVSIALIKVQMICLWISSLLNDPADR